MLPQQAGGRTRTLVDDAGERHELRLDLDRLAGLGQELAADPRDKGGGDQAQERVGAVAAQLRGARASEKGAAEG
jgi:hypothetical protein